MSPRFVRFAALFYGSLTLIAAVWCGLRGFEVRILGESPAASLLLGALTAAITVSLGLLASRLLPVVRGLSEELAPRLVDGADSASLGGLGLLGRGEEAFFRGGRPAGVRPRVASLVFGTRPRRPRPTLPFMDGLGVLAGFVFGAVYDLSGACSLLYCPPGTTPRRSCSGNALAGAS